MREIKFRAWDKKYTKMRFGNDNLLIGLNGLLFWDLGGQEAQILGMPQDTNFELMQYTGLKDKNGKEIYEGDIVRYESGDGDVVVTQVIWEEVSDETTMAISGLSFRLIKDVTDEIYNENGDAPKGWTGEPEVIGNIYENPELLKSGSQFDSR